MEELQSVRHLSVSWKGKEISSFGEGHPQAYKDACITRLHGGQCPAAEVGEEDFF